jgi:hypothetical protein
MRGQCGATMVEADGSYETKVEASLFEIYSSFTKIGFPDITLSFMPLS